MMWLQKVEHLYRNGVLGALHLKQMHKRGLWSQSAYLAKDWEEARREGEISAFLCSIDYSTNAEIIQLKCREDS